MVDVRADRGALIRLRYAMYASFLALGIGPRDNEIFVDDLSRENATVCSPSFIRPPPSAPMYG